MKKYLLVIITIAFALLLCIVASATENSFPAGATVTGHTTKMYEGSKIVDTNWAYYDDTKTLHFIGNQKSYNETGALKDCDAASSWADYKDVIEHIIVGPNITKITGVGFEGYKSLKDIRIEKTVTQIDTYAFRNCTSLTTLWINGTDRIEGRIDASKLVKTNDFFTNSAVVELVLGKNDSSPSFAVPKTLKTIYATNITDDLKLFAGSCKLTLINLVDMSVVDTNIAPPKVEYNPEGATAAGHSTKLLNGMNIVDTNWAYYADTKTLHLIGNQKSYNETGSLDNCDEGSSWAEYKDEIEHIIVGEKISKITGYAFEGYKSLKDVRIEKTVTQIDAGAFFDCPMFSTLWINGTDRVEGRIDASNLKVTSNFFKGSSVVDIVLNKNDISPNFNVPSTMVRMYSAYITDSMKIFAAENDLALIDLNTMAEVDTNVDLANSYKPEGATVSGHSSKKYEGSKIVDTFWAYYADTKTLEFVSNSNSYNETGSLADCDPSGATWAQYKEEIEHIIVGDKISKITGNGFVGYKALKDVRIGKNVVQIDAGAFTNCTSLTTIWKDGTERIEGRADLSGLSRLADAYKNTAIKEVILAPKMTEIKVSFPLTLIKIYASVITDELKAYVEENLCDLENLNDPTEVYSYYVPVDTSLPSCGARCVYDFDESTGIITIKGGGMISDIVNYYGGGSKTSPFFSIKKNVKHIVIEDTIKGIGKYAFCQFVNLETVQIPDVEGFVISNAAFEKCSNLKSVCRNGTEPIEGTADLSKVGSIAPWSFAYDYLIANVVIGDSIEEIGSSVFEENSNLANVYGTPGAFAETYAKDNGLAFYDASASSPEPIKCTPPENVSEETHIDASETGVVSDTAVSEPVETSKYNPTIVFHDGSEKSGGSALPIIIAVSAVAVVVAAVIVIVLVSKKKK